MGIEQCHGFPLLDHDDLAVRCFVDGIKQAARLLVNLADGGGECIDDLAEGAVDRSEDCCDDDGHGGPALSVSLDERINIPYWNFCCCSMQMPLLDEASGNEGGPPRRRVRAVGAAGFLRQMQG